MMNKLLILIAALSAPVMAEQASCESIGTIAETIMKARQSDRPMSKLMAVIDQYEMPSVKPMVVAAYKSRLTALKATSKKPLQSFAMTVELACYEGK